MKRACSMKLVDFGSLKALASVQLEDVEIRGFKVIDQGDGKPWVGLPSREVLKNGKKEYYDIVRFPDEETRREFCALILDTYRAHVSGSAPASGRAVAAVAAAGGGQVARR